MEKTANYSKKTRKIRAKNWKTHRLPSLLLILLLASSLLMPLTVKAGEEGGMSQISEYPFKVVPDYNIQPFQAGAWAYLHVKVENVHNQSLIIKEVLLQTDASSSAFPFEVTQTRIDGCFSNGFVKKYDGGDLSSGLSSERTKDIVFGNLVVRKDIVDGYIPLTVVIRYQVDLNEATPEQKNVLYEQKLSWDVKFLADPTNKENQRVLLEAAQLQTATGTYGQGMELTFGIVNRGFDAADIISVSPVVSGDAEKWPFEILQNDYTQAVASRLMPSGDGSSPSQEMGTLLLMNFGLMTVRSEIASGYKQVDFLVKYKVGFQAIQEATLSTYVNIIGNPTVDNKNNGNDGRDWPSSMPRLMCTGFTTEPADIVGGQDFTLHLTLKNTSTASAIQNVRLVLNAPTAGENGEPFMPKSGASALFIPYIEPDTEYTVDVEMSSSVQVPQKIYPLSIKMEYEDWKATAISTEETISIGLKQPYRVDFGHCEVMPQELSPGQEANVTFPVYNKGKTKLFNVLVNVPEGQGISGQEVYLGNLDPGNKGQVDMMVKVEEIFDSSKPRRLRLTFEDENGKVNKKDVEFNLSAVEAQEFDPMGGMGGVDGMDPEGFEDPGMGAMTTDRFAGLPIKAWYGIGSAFFFVLGVVLLLWGRKRRKKKPVLNDEAYFRELLKH